MSKWLKCKIEDVCNFIGGSQPPKSKFINYPQKSYTRLVQTRDFKTDKFPTYIPTNSTTKFFNKEDIIIGRYGPPIFQIFKGTLEGAYNVALMKAVPNENITNDFLYYFLTQKEVFEYVDNLSARTGGQTGVDLVSLYQYPINLPDKTEQRKIASVLSALDSKIELNNRINAELEAMAKTIYDYWFVQFDFPDKNGNPYKTSGGKMVWNEELKREVPEGWEVKELSEIANITMGQSPPGETYNEEKIGEIFYQGCTDFGRRFPSVRKYTTEPTRFARKSDILLSVRAPVGTMNFAKEDCCIGRGLAALSSKDNCMPYLFGVMSNLKQIFDRRNTDGTTFGSITKDDLFSIEVISPSSELIGRFDKIVGPMFNQQNTNEYQNIELAELRDWLLPMLMNGQVRVDKLSNNEEPTNMAAKEQVNYR